VLLADADVTVWVVLNEEEDGVVCDDCVVCDEVAVSSVEADEAEAAGVDAEVATDDDPADDVGAPVAAAVADGLAAATP
jgi:hypothetical protein